MKRRVDPRVVLLREEACNIQTQIRDLASASRYFRDLAESHAGEKGSLWLDRATVRQHYVAMQWHRLQLLLKELERLEGV